METDRIARRYMRLRLAAALSLVMAAALGSSLVDRVQTDHVKQRIEVSDALDAAVSAVTEQIVSLTALSDVSFERLAADERTALGKSVPLLEAAATRIREGVEQGAMSPQGRALLADPLLDPLAFLDEFAAVSRAVSQRSDLWGEAASRHVAVARGSTMQLLPVIRRVRALEAADLDRLMARLEWMRLASLATTLALLAGIWLAIFQPMEWRVHAAQARAREGLRAAEAASEAKSAFIATMSHEIRTPLTGVLGMADLLRESDLPAEERRMARTIASSGRALLGVVNDVLDFSRIEAGRLDIEAHPFDARALAAELIALFEPQARSRSVSMRIEVRGEPAARHLGDEARLRQVVSNLLGNAVKFTQEGEVVLTVEARPAEGMLSAEACEEREVLVLAVTDTGIGMEPDTLSRVFDAFEQAEGGTARRFGGTGLGLSIARRLAEAMGGRLEATSVPGEGSTFRLILELPTAPTSGCAPHDETPSDAPVVQTTTQGAPSIEVLLVDDNAVNRTIASRMLEGMGAQVTLACDGEAALAAVAATVPDLVLMDVSMPVMDGHEATRRIRAAEAREGRERLPIVALSAHVGEAHRARCFEAGMDDVLGKPFAREAIEGVLAAHARPRHTPLRGDAIPGAATGPRTAA